nr:hypothetical protein B0A51_01031 [Rachicladosporium sp. CCFEE 5018]
MALDELVKGFGDLPRDLSVTIVKRSQQSLDHGEQGGADKRTDHVEPQKSVETTSAKDVSDLIDCSISDITVKLLPEPVLPVTGDNVNVVVTNGPGTSASEASVNLADSRDLLICIAMTMISVDLLQQMLG